MPREERKAHHRVLIIDDEESTRLLLARYLSKDLKIEAQLAGTCEQALRYAGDYAYDVILLDLLMPGIGGLEVLKEIRNASPNAATPVVMISVVSDQETIERCLAAGASAYHVKPVRRAEIVATVQQQLASRRKSAR
ncbi:MAG TPA: response regulator transcription factor [Burkholderiales bacterium]|nr:response regulator transcription factor [Burkholderiales bacterium]